MYLSMGILSFRSPGAGLQVTDETGLLLPWGFWGSDPDYQVQWQEPLHRSRNTCSCTGSYDTLFHGFETLMGILGSA